jgi:predicted transposase YdaD
MYQDVLRESWVYQEIGQEFLEQGLEKGLVQGLEKGLESERQILMSIVQMHFAELASLARQQGNAIKDTEVLQNVIIKLLAVQTVNEAQRILLDANKQ